MALTCGWLSGCCSRARSRRWGLEEEFHTVDLTTRRLTAHADRLMEQLPAGSFGSELQRSVLEANSRPWVGLTDLAEDIAALRQAAIAAAEPLGLARVSDDHGAG
jgi:carboxylate-amine ligase